MADIGDRLLCSGNDVNRLVDSGKLVSTTGTLVYPDRGTIRRWVSLICVVPASFHCAGGRMKDERDQKMETVGRGKDFSGEISRQNISARAGHRRAIPDSCPGNHEFHAAFAVSASGMLPSTPKNFFRLRAANVQGSHDLRG
jgi:hypothetical protein